MAGKLQRRIGQGLRALTAFARPLDYAAAEAVLSPRLLTLFRRMRRSEQEHSLRVLRTLQAQGHIHPDLLTAALLHDVGKSRYPLTLIERVLIVLVWGFNARLAWRLGMGEPRGWKRPFVIAVRHAEWSADDMAAAGASPLAVTLARRHQEKLRGTPQNQEEQLLLWLQKADGAN